MSVADYSFSFETELAMTGTCPIRGDARMIVVDALKETVEHSHIRELPDRIKGREVWANNTKLLHWRIQMTRDTGQKVEFDLVKKVEDRVYEAMRSGAIVLFENVRPWYTEDGITASLTHTRKQRVRVEFEREPDFDKIGNLSLTPQIKRPGTKEEFMTYESSYASIPGSLIPPCAGWHLTEETRSKLDWHELSLHTSWDGFWTLENIPVSDQAGRMSQESYTIPNPPKGKVFAVGTTTVKALESYARSGKPEGSSNLFIHGSDFDFKVVDGMLTTMHFPAMSVMTMVCALGGLELVIDAHREAVEKRYRFGDYGDCFLLLNSKPRIDFHPPVL